jgi:hypothetical protein
LGLEGLGALSYLCFTRLSLPSVTENAVAIARALLDAGADPNVYFMAGDSRYTPLTGVIGEARKDGGRIRSGTRSHSCSSSAAPIRTTSR